MVRAIFRYPVVQAERIENHIGFKAGFQEAVRQEQPMRVCSRLLQSTQTAQRQMHVCESSLAAIPGVGSFSDMSECSGQGRAEVSDGQEHGNPRLVDLD